MKAEASKRQAINIFLLIASCAIFLIVVELGFKALHFFSDPEVSPSCIENLPYENTANGWFLRYAPVNGWIFYKNNSLGMRDLERTFGKDKNVKRVACLGDSIIFGGEVSFPDIFSRQLEKMLRTDLGNNIEVLNCGTTSYSLREYLVYLEKKALKFSPDLIIVGLCLNDYKSLFHQDGSEDSLLKNPSPDTMKNKKQFFESVKRFFSRSYLIEYVKDSFRTIVDNKKQKIEEEYNESKDPGLWAASRKYFTQMKNICSRNGIKLLVLIFPTADQITQYSPADEPQQFIRSMLQEEGVHYIDLLKIYYEHQRRKESVFSRFDGVHPLPLGHKLAAEAAEKKIIEDDLLNDRL